MLGLAQQIDTVWALQVLGGHARLHSVQHADAGRQAGRVQNITKEGVASTSLFNL